MFLIIGGRLGRNQAPPKKEEQAQEEELRSFESLYSTDLLPELKELDAERREIKNTLLYPTVGLGTLALVLIAVVPNLGITTLIATAIAGLGAFAWFRNRISGKFRVTFKTKVIRRILQYVDRDYTYQAFGSISKVEFDNCRMYSRRAEIYRGDDLISGKREDTEFKFSEVHAEYYQQDSKGRRTRHTLFKGLFFIADFNKHFNHTTVVIPDFSERYLGSAGNMLQKLNFGRGSLVKLENVDFEKEFVVYSDDEVEARYILTPNLMERILKFKEKYELTISLAFFDSKVHVAIPMGRDFFEPNIFKTLINYEKTEEYYHDMKMAFDIVDELNLNLRIWSKD